MAIAELRVKSVKELSQELDASRREQFNLRMQSATGQTPKPHNIRLVRKKIAQIKTLLVEKEKGSAE